MFNAFASAPDSFCTVNTRIKFSFSLFVRQNGVFSTLENAANLVVLVFTSLTLFQ